MAQDQNIVPLPQKKNSFAISRGLTVIGDFKNGAKQKFGEIVAVFGEI